MIGEIWEYFKGPRGVPLHAQRLSHHHLSNREAQFQIGDKVIVKDYMNRHDYDVIIIHYNRPYLVARHQFLAHFRRARY